MNHIFAWRGKSGDAAGARVRAGGAAVSMLAPKPILDDDSTMSTTSSGAAAALEPTADGYVNTGLRRWTTLRAEWTADPLPARRRHLSDAQEDDVYDELMRAEHRPLPKHTSLSLVIRILPEVWERERRALMMSAPRR